MKPTQFSRPTVTHIGRSTIQNTPIFALSPEAIRNALQQTAPETPKAVPTSGPEYAALVMSVFDDMDHEAAREVRESRAAVEHAGRKRL